MRLTPLLRVKQISSRSADATPRLCCTSHILRRYLAEREMQTVPLLLHSAAMHRNVKAPWYLLAWLTPAFFTAATPRAATGFGCKRAGSWPQAEVGEQPKHPWCPLCSSLKEC